MAKYKLWYVPMSHEYGYASSKFFKTREDMEKFLETFENSYGDEEWFPTGRQPGNEFEFEINDEGEIVLPKEEL